MRGGHLAIGAGAAIGIYGLVLKHQGREQLGSFVLGAGTVVAIGGAASLVIDDEDMRIAGGQPRTGPRFQRASRGAQHLRGR